MKTKELTADKTKNLRNVKKKKQEKERRKQETRRTVMKSTR
jgi:hypothetical protein